MYIHTYMYTCIHVIIIIIIDNMLICNMAYTGPGDAAGARRGGAPGANYCLIEDVYLN